MGIGDCRIIKLPVVHSPQWKLTSSGSVCMVLASAWYDERDYFRDYGDFRRAVTP